MARRRQFLKTTAAAGSTIALTGCLGTLTGGGGSEALTIGFNAPLTGFASADGQSAKQGAKLAQKLINQNGGVNGNDLELLIKDDAAKADQAIPVAKDFINNENVDVGISGSYSTPTRAIAPIYNKNQIPFISAYATHPDITNGKYTYRVGIWAPIHGRVGAKIGAENLNAETAALGILNNDFGKTISNQFRESANQRGIDIVYEATYDIGASNFRSMLNSVKDHSPDMLYATGYYHEAANIVKQAEEVGIDAQIMGEEGYDSPKFFELGGKACNGTIISTNLNRGSSLDATQTFIQKYRNEYGMRSDMVAANCYDAVRLAAKAANAKGTTEASAITSYIDNLTNWKGAATGPIHEFIGPGEAVRPIPIQKVKNMQWTEYDVVTDKQIIRPNV